MKDFDYDIVDVTYAQKKQQPKLLHNNNQFMLTSLEN